MTIVPVEDEKANFKGVTKTMVTTITRQAERGTSLVTAAFTALPIMETGAFFGVQRTLIDVANKGARLEIVPLSRRGTLASKQEIATAIDRQPASIQSKSIRVDAKNSPAAPLDFAKVCVAADCSLMMLFDVEQFELHSNGEALMQNERNP
jgi:hypothetical protein